MAAARREARSRAQRRRSGRRGQQDRRGRASRGLPYTRWNVVMFAVALGVIVVGYICLSRPPVDGFLSLTLAPVLLVLGYCVLIPIALLMGGTSGKEASTEASGEDVGG